jgi:hypothetical protein
LPRKPSEVVELLRTASPTLMKKAIAMALGGDRLIIKALLDRMLPRGRLVTLPGPLPSTPLESVDVVIAAAASGALTPEEAMQLVGLVATRLQIAELPGLQERLAKLEALLAGKPGVLLDAAIELDK